MSLKTGLLAKLTTESTNMSGQSIQKLQADIEGKLKEIMEKESSCLEFHDIIRQTLLNPFTKKENMIEAEQISYFAEGIGLVEWHSLNKKVHFRLEQILNQDEWLKIISH